MHKLKPKKHLGQHFLRDMNIARKITASLKAEKSTQVVEIGPGEGVLSDLLAAVYDDLTLVEIDPDAAELLEGKFAGTSVVVLNEDFLKWDMETMGENRVSFIGNLPYNVSSPIFFRLLENNHLVEEGVFMVQKEVAQRICSGPGNKVYGILSVLMGYFFELKYEFSVSEKVFFPQPRVKSAVFSMRNRNEEKPITFKELAKVVKAAFGKRRKTVRNAIKGLNCPVNERTEPLLGMRAEQLSLAEFELLTIEIRNSGNED